jgi:hypothetical protein
MYFQDENLKGQEGRSSFRMNSPQRSEGEEEVKGSGTFNLIV